MILDVLKQAEGELAQFTEFNKDKSQFRQLEDTLAKLCEVNQRSATLRATYALLAARVHTELAPDFLRRVDGARLKLEESQSKFATSAWQVNPLKGIQADLDRLSSELQSAWTVYAQRAIQPQKELFRLLKELPEVKRSEGVIHQAFEQLSALAQTPPQNESALQRFDRDLAQITDTITHVDGITPVIQGFLQRTHQGTFSIADLNDEILDWCRVNERGRSFRIQV
jgi:hypothetical protein